jgi:hypothetical protein
VPIAAPTFGRTPSICPAAAGPPLLANEAVVEAKTTKNTEAIFTALFDMGSSSKLTPRMQRKFEKPADTTKLKFKSITVRPSRRLHK